MRNLRNVIVVCAALAVSSALTMYARQISPKPGQDAGGLGAPIKMRPLETRVVKGMPYSAEIVSESVQTLADGNRIVQRSTGRVYRDVDGRVRREDDRPSGSPSISITDPVADTSFTLDVDNRTASETAGLRLIDFQVFAGTLGLNGTYRVEGSPAVDYLLTMPVRTSQLDPTAGGAPSAGGGGRGGAGAGTKDVGSARAAGFGGRGTGTGVGGGRGAARGEQVEEKLPNRWVENVLCTGVRRTTTIAQGAIGNDLPIKIVSEEWTSIDLQVLVLTDFNDPRTGRSIYQLQSINRVNPATDLFKVPSDYTVQRAGGRGRGGKP